MKTTVAVCRYCMLAFLINLVLFGVKLYIGLATNSIAIYSDAVNNLLDSLSVLLTFVCLRIMLRTADRNSRTVLRKGEQIFSFLIAIITVLTGLYFAYSSLERFMYPTPVWYTMTYLYVLVFTAAVKLGMFFLLRMAYRYTQSPVMKITAYDSLLDFFITAVTVLTLILSGTRSFSFDALFGLLISVMIVVPAVKIVIAAGAALINYVPAALRARVNAVCEEQQLADQLLYIKYMRDGDETEGYAFFQTVDFDADALTAQIQAQTDIKIYICTKESAL